MSDLTIKTNRRWRDFVYRHDVPAKVLADQFDYQDGEDVIDGFFCYRGRWYHSAFPGLSERPFNQGETLCHA